MTKDVGGHLVIGRPGHNESLPGGSDRDDRRRAPNRGGGTALINAINREIQRLGGTP